MNATIPFRVFLALVPALLLGPLSAAPREPRIAPQSALASDPDLVAWYRFENDARDSSRNGIDGVSTPAVYYVEDRFGNLRSAANFSDPSAARIEFGNVPAFNEIGNRFTIAFWIRIVGGNGGIVINHDILGTRHDDWTIGVMGKGTHTGAPYLALGNPAATASRRINDGLWHHVAIRRQRASASLDFFVDGEKVPYTLDPRLEGGGLARDLSAPCSTNLGPYRVMGWTAGFAGTLDELFFFRRLLSDQEIQTLAADEDWSLVKPGAVPQQALLIGHWPLDEGKGTLSRDMRPAGRELSLHGARWTRGIVGPHALDLSEGYAIAADGGGPDLRGSFSLSVWFKKNRVPLHGATLGLVNMHHIGVDGDGSWELSAEVAPNAQIQFSNFSRGYGTCNDFDGGDVGPILFAMGAWYHLALAYDDQENSMTLYLDGKRVKKARWSSEIGDLDLPLVLGATLWPGNHPRGRPFFLGAVDDLRIYSGVLSPGEVERLHGLRNASWVDAPVEGRHPADDRL